MNLCLAFALTLLAQPGPPQDSVDGTRLVQTLRSLPEKRSALGTPERRAGLVETEHLIETALKEAGYTPRLEEFMWRHIPTPAPKKRDPADDRPVDAKSETTPDKAARPEAKEPPEGTAGPWHNIIVDLPGTDLAGEVLLVGAHFDAVALGPGADDNGTGAAALLEIARVLRTHPMRRTVRLAFFNLEEAGYVGSLQHAKQYPVVGRPRPAPGDAAAPSEPPPIPANAAGEKLVGMISLEMLGYYSDKPRSQRSPFPPVKGVFEPPTVADFLGLATTASHAPFAKQLDDAMHAAEPKLKTFAISFLPDPPLTPPDLLRSDHAPFLFRGYPAVIVTDTANFRNPNYHKPTDTVDTIDAERYTLAVRALAGAIYTIAQPAEKK